MRNNKKQIIIDSRKVYIKPNFSWNTEIKCIPYEERAGFLYVGRLERIKGIDLLLRAWRKLNEMHQSGLFEIDRNINKTPCLTVCGTGPMKKACTDYVNRFCLNEVVKYTGQVSHEEVLIRMSKVKALIMPSRCFESFPMIIVEAMSVGTPVITCKGGNAEALIRMNDIGIAVDATVGALCDAVNKMNAENRASCERVKRAFLEKYTPIKNLEALRQIYDISEVC